MIEEEKLSVDQIDNFKDDGALNDNIGEENLDIYKQNANIIDDEFDIDDENFNNIDIEDAIIDEEEDEYNIIQNNNIKVKQFLHEIQNKLNHSVASSKNLQKYTNKRNQNLKQKQINQSTANAISNNKST